MLLSITSSLNLLDVFYVMMIVVLSTIIIKANLRTYKRRKAMREHQRKLYPVGGMSSFLVLTVFCVMAGSVIIKAKNVFVGSDTSTAVVKKQEKKIDEYSYRAGGDMFLDANPSTPIEWSEEQNPEVAIAQVVNQPEVRRLNVAPGDQSTRVKSNVQHVATTKRFERQPEREILYYVQLSTSETLDGALKSIAQYEAEFPGQMHLAKDTEADRLRFKVLMGKFASKSNARAAIGDSKAYVRNELERNLIFIEY